MSYRDCDEIAAIGFASVGKDVRISTHASIYAAERIAIGDHVRIDDFCILSSGPGGIEIGSYVHIAAYSSIIGAGKVTLEDFANISSRVGIYSSSDDFSGRTMTSPLVDDRFKAVDNRPVCIGRHVVIGTGSVVLPGVTLHQGVSIGALSLVKSDCDEFGIYAGSPAIRVGDRSRELLEAERRFLSKTVE
jgi:galactoside O-acetyltransferase